MHSTPWEKVVKIVHGGTEALASRLKTIFVKTSPKIELSIYH